MQAVIMAGGRGTRLACVTKDEIPKPMAPAAGRPLLLWQIEELKRNGIQDVIMIIGHLGHKIEAYFGDGSRYGMHITYVREHAPLGTAGAFYYLKDMLKDSEFLLVFGDVFFSIDIARMHQFYLEKNAVAALFVHPNNHPFDSDLVVLDADAKVTAFDSKHNRRDYCFDNCVNAGIYLLSSRVCEMAVRPVRMDLEQDILSVMIADGAPVYGYRSPEYVKDIGTVERIRQAELDISNGLARQKCLKYPQRGIYVNVELKPHAADAVRLINQSGLLGIGMEKCQDKKTVTMLGRAGVYLDDYGSIMECAQKYNIILNDSWLVGDNEADLRMAESAGLHTALVQRKTNGTAHNVWPELTCESLYEAVQTILQFH